MNKDTDTYANADIFVDEITSWPSILFVFGEDVNQHMSLEFDDKDTFKAMWAIARCMRRYGSANVIFPSHSVVITPEAGADVSFVKKQVSPSQTQAASLKTR